MSYFNLKNVFETFMSVPFLYLHPRRFPSKSAKSDCFLLSGVVL